MRTSGFSKWWVPLTDKDRTHQYFETQSSEHPAGTLYSYATTGSQVLSFLVEKITGKSVLEFLRERIFNHLNIFKNVEILKLPNSDSWGDSGLICTTYDMASFGRFLSYGTK